MKYKPGSYVQVDFDIHVTNRQAIDSSFGGLMYAVERALRDSGFTTGNPNVNPLSLRIRYCDEDGNDLDYEV